MDTSELLAQLGITRSGSNHMMQPELSRILGMHGRGGDDTVAHLDSGEIVIPKRAQTPELLVMFEQAARQAGLEPDRFVVGRDNNVTNPRTGMIEFDDGGSGDGTGDGGGGGHGGGGGVSGGSSAGSGNGGNGSGEGGSGGFGPAGSGGPDGSDPGVGPSDAGFSGITGSESANAAIGMANPGDTEGRNADYGSPEGPSSDGFSGWLNGLFAPAENPGDRFATPSGKGLGFMGLGLGLAPGIGLAMGISNGLTSLGVESTPDNPGHGVGKTSTSTTSPNGVGSSTTASASDNGSSTPSTLDMAEVIERTADKPRNPGVTIETPRRTNSDVIQQMLNDAQTRRTTYLNSTLGK